ncbi:MAG: efflux RND transporter periplasmic adaptor subunit [Alphaproteobacteria bacterium]|nr:efflux RND transporter periplasmic adaptor subunit [Alphaproteobacteria bacterium]
MKKWIFLAVLIAFGSSLAALHATGKIDLNTKFDQLSGKAKEVAAKLAHDQSEPAGQSKTNGTAPLAPAVTVATVAPRSFSERIMVTGTLVAREEILIAPEVEGLRIVSLQAEAGDTVRKGQVLATLEKETLEARRQQTLANLQRTDATIAQANSNIAQAEATLEEAEAQLARAEPLRKSKYLSESVFDQRRAAARTARAGLSTARDGVLVAEAEKAQIAAQLRELDWNLTRTEIRAPATGLITRRTARIGDVAYGTKSPMFVLARDGEIELEAAVTEPKLARITAGQSSQVEVAGAGIVEGKVRLVSPEIDASTRLGSVRIFLGNAPQLKVGAFGRASILAATSTGLAIPTSAVLFDNGEAFVQVVRDGKVKTTRVVCGLTSDGEVEISEGVAEGDIVVARAGTFLRDGDAVRTLTSPPRLSEAGK